MVEPETSPQPGGLKRPPDWRPGDRRPDTRSMLRVDQAGEFGATRIYAGQLAVLGSRHGSSHVIARMAAQEERHLSHFNGMLSQRGVRPTLLHPVWRAAGFALGATTALISPEAAMACTAAVEDEIEEHYSEQRRALASDDPPLAAAIEEFQAEEVEHRDIALAAGAEKAVAFPLLYSTVRAGCRFAIALSKRI